MHVNKPTIAFAVIALLIMQHASSNQTAADKRQNPAPPLSWQDWQLVGSCGGVDFLAAISVDDGRNDLS